MITFLFLVSLAATISLLIAVAADEGVVERSVLSVISGNCNFTQLEYRRSYGAPRTFEAGKYLPVA